MHNYVCTFIMCMCVYVSISYNTVQKQLGYYRTHAYTSVYNPRIRIDPYVMHGESSSVAIFDPPSYTLYPSLRLTMANQTKDVWRS